MKTMNEFAEQIVSEIPLYLSEKVINPEIRTESVLKENDQIYTALIIQEENVTNYPRIYLEDYYFSYRNGTGMDEILNELSGRYEKLVEYGKTLTKKAEIMKEPEEAKKLVTLRLVNKDRNEKLLEDRPHTDIGDLTCIYDVDLGYDSRIPITEKVQNQLGLSREELHDLAMENTPRIKPALIQTVGETLPFGIGPGSDSMLVITNKEMIDGASVILYPGVAETIRDRLDGDFYILPSSVHELMAVRKEDARLTALESIVRDVNENAFFNNQQDILSDHVYECTEKGLERAVSRSERQRPAPELSMDAR